VGSARMERALRPLCGCALRARRAPKRHEELSFVNFVLFVVNSRCLETAMLHPCCLALNVGLGLEGSPLGKKRSRL
jgi:hypothetical protein